VVEGETCDNGFTVNVATLALGPARLQVTSTHPDSGGARDGCRAEKLDRMFAALGGLRPTLPTVVSGDMNLDPYRTSTPRRRCGTGTSAATARRPTATAPASPRPIRRRSPPTSAGLSQEDPTGLVLDGVTVPTGPCASTLDHVAATPDVTGPVRHLGRGPR
jgi:endonuclease/exonuclease/phosphatase family metal-dependent hydrolase